MGKRCSTNGKIWMGNSLATKGPFQRRGKPILQIETRTKSISTLGSRRKRQPPKRKVTDVKNGAHPKGRRHGEIQGAKGRKGEAGN